MHFQDSNGQIVIRQDLAQFLCPSAEFPRFEPTYEAPPAHAIRIWTDAYQCLQYNGNQTGDPFYTPARLAAYVETIAVYQAAYDAAHAAPPHPAIYVYAVLDKAVLLADDPNDAIRFAVDLKASPDPLSPTLPKTATWPINLRNKTGDVVDNVLLDVVNGHCTYLYRTVGDLPYGEYRLDAADFDPVEFEGTTYQVLLGTPVQFTVTRRLETP